MSDKYIVIEEVTFTGHFTCKIKFIFYNSNISTEFNIECNPNISSLLKIMTDNTLLVYDSAKYKDYCFSPIPGHVSHGYTKGFYIKRVDNKPINTICLQLACYPGITLESILATIDFKEDRYPVKAKEQDDNYVLDSQGRKRHPITGILIDDEDCLSGPIDIKGTL